MSIHKALTICQPYPYLILLPASDPNHKRVENRDWPTSYRGELLIHAGKSKAWLSLSDDKSCDENYDIPLADLVFGAIVGAATLTNCFRKELIDAEAKKGLPGWMRLAAHPHTNGPWCWVLSNVRRFIEPVPYKGAQGIFNVPAEVVAEQMAKAVAV